ncbi:MAG: helix-turn-helix transcriptional regulator [Clostridia bacterium]|nr:helix-turn-helix transcriptional regulator [Clostridia bacterium]
MYECNISTKLLELRTSAGATQEEVALALGVSNKTISKWETGASAPDLSMLIALSKYYNVSTDTLLGTDDRQRTTVQTIADAFNGLDRRETALKTFEIIKAIFPVSYRVAETKQDHTYDDVIPPKSEKGNRYQVALPESFHFAVCSDDVNMAIFQLRNKANFSWMNNEEPQEKIITLLHFLADPAALKICAFIHTTTCSEHFTADYMAKNTGVSAEKTVEILENFCEIGLCYKTTAHLHAGEITLYESFGDGLLLAILSLAYERMCGKDSYHYNYNGSCKMIGG